MKNFHLITNNVQVFTKSINWRKIKKILIIILIILLSLLSTYKKLHAVTSCDFTNQNYTLNQVNKFIKSFPNNKMTREEVYHVWWHCNAWVIHPITALTVQEKESGTVTNPEGNKKYKWRHHRCMGYGLIEQTWNDSGKFYKFGGFYVQVHCGIKALRKSLDRWHYKGWNSIEFSIENKKEKVKVDNPIDYALYRYTPFQHGKNDFDKIFMRFKKRWHEVNG